MGAQVPACNKMACRQRDIERAQVDRSVAVRISSVYAPGRWAFPNNGPAGRTHAQVLAYSKGPRISVGPSRSGRSVQSSINAQPLEWPLADDIENGVDRDIL